MPSSGNEQEGLQYLCAKYSSLMARLKDEVSQRQQAEAMVRVLEKRLCDETARAEAERQRWDEERQALRQDIAGLNLARKELEAVKTVEAADKQCPAANSRLNDSYDRLHEACAEESRKTMHIVDQASMGTEILVKQGEELNRLRLEHSELTTQHRAVYEELVACRDHLTRLRRKISELEARAEAAAQSREAAEAKTRHLQEELRQALRALQAARSREALAASNAERDERELRSREARLAAVRKQGQRLAQRATSAERRLASVAGFERCQVETVSRMQSETCALQQRLDAELRACEAAKLAAARAEATEARLEASAQEARHELQSRDDAAASSQRRVVELETELNSSRIRLERLAGQHTSSTSAIDGLRLELRAARAECEQAQQVRERFASEASDSRRRLERGTPQLTECKRRLANAEEALARAQAETLEERRARERCHVEAIRANEKLRAARSQSDQWRKRVRALEEMELRYPSRGRRAEDSNADDGLSLEADICASVGEAPCAEEWSCHDAGTGSADNLRAIQAFVANEEQRLVSVERACIAQGDASMWEEPRMLAAPTEAPPCRPDNDEFSALLAAKPRVLKLPEALTDNPSLDQLRTVVDECECFQMVVKQGEELAKMRRSSSHTGICRQGRVDAGVAGAGWDDVA